MKTPQEKAEQLYNKVWYSGNYNDNRISHICAVDISIILVDEICEKFYPVSYWEKVRIELENMKTKFIGLEI